MSFKINLPREENGYRKKKKKAISEREHSLGSAVREYIANTLQSFATFGFPIIVHQSSILIITEISALT